MADNTSSPFGSGLRQILLEIDTGSDSALRKLLLYLVSSPRTISRQENLNICRALLGRLEQDTSSLALKLSFECLTHIISNPQSFGAISPTLLPKASIPLRALDIYMSDALLQIDLEGVDEAWNFMEVPVQCLRLLVLRELEHTSIPPSALQSARCLLIRVWVFYSQTLHLRRLASLSEFEGLCDVTANLLDGDHFPLSWEDLQDIEKHLAHNGILDLCISQLEGFRQRHNPIPLSVVSGAQAVLRFVFENMKDQRVWAFEHARLVPVLTGLLRKLVVLPERGHFETTEYLAGVVFRTFSCLAMYVLHSPLRTIRMFQALNCGLWSALHCTFLFGACPCAAKRIFQDVPDEQLPDLFCPWSANGFAQTGLGVSELGEEFMQAIAELLLDGHLSMYRQMEKAMRRSAYEDAKTACHLKYTISKEWKEDVSIICQLLEKRRQYNESLRSGLCGNRNCPEVHLAPKCLLICSGCRSSFYCSHSCQKEHWAAFHRDECHKEPLSHSCIYPLDASRVDYDFYRWLEEDSPVLVKATYKIVEG